MATMLAQHITKEGAWNTFVNGLVYINTMKKIDRRDLRILAIFVTSVASCQNRI